MKLLLFTLLLSAVPQWVSTTVACDKEGEPCKKIFVTSDGSKIQVKTIGGVDGNGNVSAFAFVSASGEAAGEDGRSEPKIIRLRKLQESNKDRGWLGVSIGTVSKALADQLGTEGSGTLILNVVEGSPADEAGLEDHDVILAINGEDVGVKVGNSVKLIKANKPGDDVELLILRDGREQKVNVTLGSRPDMKGFNFEWKFEGEPFAEIEEKIVTRGKMLMKDGDGEWIFKDLGNLEELKNLPDHIKMIMPHTGTRTIVINSEGESNTITVEVLRDGNVIAISREGDGEITVTRTDQNDNETVNTYATEDDLEAGDEEAFEIFSKTGSANHFVIDMDGMEAFGDLDFDFDFDFDGKFNFVFDTDAWQEQAGEWQEKLEESLSQISESYDGSMEKLHGILAELTDVDGNSQLLKLHKLSEGLHGLKGHALAPRMLRFQSKPKYSFEVRSDGTIEAKIRKGDSEITRLFDDENDLYDRDRKLYEKYDKLMTDDE